MAILSHRWRLFGILALAAAFRIVLLSDNPPGLFRDEADKGYSTYSLIRTGEDLGGRRWPLQIKSFEAYTSPFYHWLSIPSIRFLGLSLFSTRLVSALAGTLACGAVYLLGSAWSSRKLGLLAALLLAVSPWHLLFSRWANQGILMTLFIPLAVWATWRMLEEPPERGRGILKWIVAGGIFWGLSWNTYAPARLFVPLFMASIFLVQLGFSKSRWHDCLRLFLAGLISLVVAAPFAIDIFLNWEQTQSRLEFLTTGEPLTPSVFFINYFKHWDPYYLFWAGDSNPRHHIPGQGQLGFLEGILAVVGLFGLSRTTGTWRGWLLLWLVLAPVPAAITHEGLPHALRSLMIVPAFSLLAATGLAWLGYASANFFSKRIATAGLSVLVIAQSVYTGFLFFREYPRDEWVAYSWETGLVEAIEWVEETRRYGEVCVVTGILEYPEAYLRFVLKPDPESEIENNGFEGFRTLPLGQAIDPRVDTAPGLYLERSRLGGKPPSWRKVPPAEGFEKMDLYWRLYRVGE